jgi:glutamate racemase
VIDEIQRALGTSVRIIDTSEAVAAQVARRFGTTAAGSNPVAARLESTGDVARLQAVANRWLDFGFKAGQAPEALR